MPMRLWADHRNACLLTLALLVICIVVSPWFLLTVILPIGWVVLKDEGSGEDQPPERIISPEETNSIEALTGADLLAKVKELGDVSKSDLVQACGYVSTKNDGGGKLNFTAFYEALLEAKGVSLKENITTGKEIVEQQTPDENNNSVKILLGNVHSILDIDRARVFKITVIETGGEFTAGIISDEETVEQIKQSINDGDMGSYIDLPNGDSFDANSFNDEFSIYGPHVPGSKLLIEEAYGISDGSGALVQNFTEIFEGPIEKSGIGIFMSSNPYPAKISEEQLLVFTKKYEKRIYNSFIINIPKGEEFDMRDIYIGTMLMDETFLTNDEIIEHFLYIPKKYLKAYLKEYLEDDESLDSDLDEEMVSLIQEIYSETPELAKKITQQHSITSEDCEGKGEWECDYVKIIDAAKKVLFEGGDY